VAQGAARRLPWGGQIGVWQQMAWVKRRSHYYFYRCHRVAGRVRQVYLGRGELAQVAAQADALRLAQRQQHAQQLRQLQQRLQTAHDALQTAGLEAELLTRAGLVAEGFYQHHHSEWRQRRERQRCCEPAQHRRVQAAG